MSKIAGIEQKFEIRYVHGKIKISYIGWGIRSAIWVIREAGHLEGVDSYRPCAWELIAYEQQGQPKVIDR